MRREAPVPAPVLAAVRAAFLEAGGEILDAPLLQPLGLLLELAGEDIRGRLFVVQREGGEEACLRPDFTIAAIRAHIESAAPSARYFYEGAAYRVAPSGASRAEEFLQIGLEAFEAGDTIGADAEMAAIAWRAAVAGGRDDLTLLFGDVGLFAAFLSAIGVAEPLAARLRRAFSSPRRLRNELASIAERQGAAQGGQGRLAALLGGLPEDEAVGVLEEVWALAGVAPVGGRRPAEIVHRLVQRAALAEAPAPSEHQTDLISRFLAISDAPDRAMNAVAALAGAKGGAWGAALEAWRGRLACLAQAGVSAERMHFSAAFGRSFGYYDGVLFEVRSRALGDEQPVAAGGRYDALPRRLGAKLNTGAVGCMVRPGRAWSGAVP
ncbi:MAG TPA: ATP phosphoribosyltransferase regulatory subunit [Caulobacteraceae bacterium]